MEGFEAVRHIVVMTDREHRPEAKPSLLCYEELLEAQDDRYDWPELDEHAAAGICYTSVTTGHPKGVVYSHRSTVLHALGVCMPGCLGVTSEDAVLAVVPMFHVNAWGFP